MNNEISLSIETSGRIGSVAIARGNEIIEEVAFSAPLRHGAETLPSIDTLFKKHRIEPKNLDVIYVSEGPGSFTGIRLAVTMSKTIAYAVGAKIVPVPSMEAQALNADQARNDGLAIDHIGVVLEAGRGKIFAAAFEYSPNCHFPSPSGTYVPNYLPITKPEMVCPEKFLAQLPPATALIGEGLKYHSDEFSDGKIIILDEKYHQTRASFVFECGILRRKAGLFTDFDSFTPLYMRKPEAELNLEKAE